MRAEARLGLGLEPDREPGPPEPGPGRVLGVQGAALAQGLLRLAPGGPRITP